MDEDDFKLAACAALTIAVVMKKKKRKIWVKEWLLARENKSVYNNLFQELRVDDAESYRRYLRMNTDTLQELLQSVTPKLEKRGTTMRKPLSVEEKLICTLRFLATGEAFSSLQYQFRISKSTISLFVPEVCEAIYNSLKEEYLKFPTTKEEWLKISNDIYKHWQFPNSIGCMDGKHIAVFSLLTITLFTFPPQCFSTQDTQNK